MNAYTSVRHFLLLILLENIRRRRIAKSYSIYTASQRHSTREITRISALVTTNNYFTTNRHLLDHELKVAVKSPVALSSNCPAISKRPTAAANRHSGYPRVPVNQFKTAALGVNTSTRTSSERRRRHTLTNTYTNLKACVSHVTISHVYSLRERFRFSEDSRIRLLVSAAAVETASFGGRWRHLANRLTSRGSCGVVLPQPTGARHIR
jgi:hypothetical protein